MTMTKESPTLESEEAFWLKHPDPTQASVHLALQWLAFVYPASELQIDRTLKSALPYADTDLSARWSQFLETHGVEQHVDALQWISQNLSSEQVPFLVETCWRLLLVDHELPTHVPLALRIMGQVLNIEESRMYEIGEEVFREYTDGSEEKQKAPLLPLDPRYLDRVEWRLYGHSSSHRSVYRTTDQKVRDNRGVFGFMWGSVFGALIVVGLVFGPWQLGRITVSRIMPQGEMLGLSSLPAPAAAESEVPAAEPVAPPPPATIVADIAANESETVATDAELIPPVEEVITTASDAPALVEQAAIEDTAPVAEQSTVITEPIELTSPVPADDVVVTGERVLMEVTASILNVRDVPQVDGDIVLKLAESARVWAYPESSEGLWMLVRVQGESGYVSARFLREVP